MQSRGRLTVIIFLLNSNMSHVFCSAQHLQTHLFGLNCWNCYHGFDGRRSWNPRGRILGITNLGCPFWVDFPRGSYQERPPGDLPRSPWGTPRGDRPRGSFQGILWGDPTGVILLRDLLGGSRSGDPPGDSSGDSPAETFRRLPRRGTTAAAMHGCLMNQLPQSRILWILQVLADPQL